MHGPLSALLQAGVFLAPKPWDDPRLFGEQIVLGLATGAVYALVALAIVLIYRSTDIINFAQSEMAMFGTFAMWSIWLSGVPFFSNPWALLVLAGLFGLGLGAVVERVVIRPVEGKPLLTIVVVTLGLFLLLNSVATWIWAQGELPKSFPSPLSVLKAVDIGFANIPQHHLLIFGVGVATMVLLGLLFNYTKLGLAMRATAQNPLAARLMGINVGNMLTLGWALSGTLGGISGALIAPVLSLHPAFMLSVLLYAFAAAVLGGLNSVPGAVVGGFIIGVAENLLGTYTPHAILGPEMKLPLALMLLVAILLVRPTGLLGERAVRRV
ncbi:High-affinity branched-chain amino acid transport system permease protein LivH [bacterium HR24]|nr:High-affinity branched-chain amino acid transport system permease protein LivH [bacterium HR24]